MEKGRNTNENKKRGTVTQQVCDDAKKMLEAGLNQDDIGRILGFHSTTISKIKKTGFNLEAYLKFRTETNGNKKNREEEKPAEEQVPGQMEMELPPAEEPKTEYSEQVKMMRFQAGQVERLAALLGRIDDHLCMVLRRLERVQDGH